jgi:hypothetical protein
MNQIISISYIFVPKFTILKIFNKYDAKIIYCKLEINCESVTVKAAPRRRAQE